MPRSLRRGTTLGAAVDITVVLAPELADGEPVILLQPRRRWGGVQRLATAMGRQRRAAGRGQRRRAADGEVRRRIAVGRGNDE